MSKQISAMAHTWKNVEMETLANMSTDLLGICVLLLACACHLKLLTVQPENLQVYPNYLFLYYLDLLGPSLGIIFSIVPFFWKKALRRHLKEELKSMFSKITILKH